ncbi:hypothetical protein [Streptomyces sp. CA-179760]|uniref:hypothetical protein n=1 Tax=Streptomyces sp. CA-179760 TaxID=3240054 RepID=UPI003D8DE318
MTSTTRTVSRAAKLATSALAEVPSERNQAGKVPRGRERPPAVRARLGTRSTTAVRPSWRTPTTSSPAGRSMAYRGARQPARRLGTMTSVVLSTVQFGTVRETSSATVRSKMVTTRRTPGLRCSASSA